MASASAFGLLIRIHNLWKSSDDGVVKVNQIAPILLYKGTYPINVDQLTHVVGTTDCIDGSVSIR
jgi:hypothetical protein